jgi:hypothetical protein
MNKLLAIKKKYNTEFKDVESLCTYIRFANRYKCTRFTPEFTELSFSKVNSYLLHSSSESDVAPSVIS